MSLTMLTQFDAICIIQDLDAALAYCPAGTHDWVGPWHEIRSAKKRFLATVVQDVIAETSPATVEKV